MNAPDGLQNKLLEVVFTHFAAMVTDDMGEDEQGDVWMEAARVSGRVMAVCHEGQLSLDVLKQYESDAVQHMLAQALKPG